MKDVAVTVGLLVLTAILAIAAGYATGIDATHKKAAQLGYGEYRVDPVNGGDATWYWYTNRLDIRK